MNKLVKTVRKDALCEEFSKVMNGILNLTNKELLILTKIIQYDMYGVFDESEGKHLVNTGFRKVLMDEVRVSSYNLSRYIGKFKDKKILIRSKTDGNLLLNPALVPEIIGDRLQITIIIRIKDED
jgi:hypothetical protein